VFEPEAIVVPRRAQERFIVSLREPPLQLVRLAFEETQGNPFFVEEVYKSLVEEGKTFDAGPWSIPKPGRIDDEAR